MIDFIDRLQQQDEKALHLRQREDVFDNVKHPLFSERYFFLLI